MSKVTGLCIIHTLYKISHEVRAYCVSQIQIVVRSTNLDCDSIFYRSFRHLLGKHLPTFVSVPDCVFYPYDHHYLIMLSDSLYKNEDAQSDNFTENINRNKKPI